LWLILFLFAILFFFACLIANNTDSKQYKSTVDIVINQVLQRWKEFAIKDDRAQQVSQDTKILLSCERLDMTYKETEMRWSKNKF
jgi:hypothetical protein